MKYNHAKVNKQKLSKFSLSAVSDPYIFPYDLGTGKKFLFFFTIAKIIMVLDF